MFHEIFGTTAFGQLFYLPRAIPVVLSISNTPRKNYSCFGLDGQYFLHLPNQANNNSSKLYLQEYSEKRNARRGKVTEGNAMQRTMKEHTYYGGNCEGSTEETTYGGESVQRRVQYNTPWVGYIHTHTKGFTLRGRILGYEAIHGRHCVYAGYEHEKEQIWRRQFV